MHSTRKVSNLENNKYILTIFFIESRVSNTIIENYCRIKVSLNPGQASSFVALNGEMSRVQSTGVEI